MGERAWLIAIIFFGGALGQAPRAHADDPLVDAARRRESDTKSVRIHYHLKEFCAKGSVSSTDAGVISGLPGGDKSKVIPPADTTFESDNVLIFHEGKVRLEQNHPMWHLPEGQLYKKPHLHVSNGDVAMTYHADGVGNDNQRSGTIYGSHRIADLQTHTMMALVLNLRGANAEISPYLVTEAKPTGQTETLTGTKCAVYRIGQRVDRDLLLWVDAGSGHVIRRVRSVRGGRVAWQCDVSPQEVRPVGQVPASWTLTEFDDAGKVQSTVAGTVTKFELGPSVSSDQFVIDYPEGTRIYDHRTKRDYRVESDGGMRETDPRGRPLAVTADQPGASWLARHKWLTAAAALSMALVLVWAGYIRRRRSHGDGDVDPPGT